MTEQWQELKETITELRDNDGTATQQEVCKFLANLMDVLEKQMQEPCEDCISRKALLEEIENGIKAGNYEEGYEEYPHINDMDDIIECIKYADSIQPKTGHWIDVDGTWFKCSECDAHRKMPPAYKEYYCPNCGAKMAEGK